MRPILIVCMFLCTFSCSFKNFDETPTQTHNGIHNQEHLGCAENEVDEDGKCVLAEKNKNNMSLFDKDLTDVISEEVIVGDLKGFYAQPKGEGNYPGIVMIHEWWGLNENIKYMAQLLASEGYKVFAIDLYNGELATDSEVAKKLSGEVRNNPEKATEKMKLATQYLKTEKKSSKIASLGWCFGGQQSLNLSLSTPLDATVIYYGHLVDNTDILSRIKGPVLGIFGEKDQSITVDSVKRFETGLLELGIKHQIHIYPGVGHAFANPSGANYSAQETIDAWDKTLTFLKENL